MLTDQLQSTKNPNFMQTNDVLLICKPLFEQLKVNHFRFLRVYKDEARIILTTNLVWLKHFINKNYHTIAWTDSKTSGSFSERYLLWDEKSLTDDNIVGIDNRKLFNMNHGITIIKNSQNYSEYYDFTTKDNESGVNSNPLYLFDLYERFIFFFKDKANKLIDKCEKNKIYLPRGSNYKTDNRISNYLIDRKKDALFIENTPISRFYLTGGNENHYLTHQEIKCIYWTLEGKTSSEIAMIIGLSNRTIEEYLSKLQIKFNCTKKTQLIAKLKTLDIDSAIREYKRSHLNK